MSLNQNILYKLERDMFISIMVRKEQVYLIHTLCIVVYVFRTRVFR